MTPPTCSTCLRNHWEIVATATAARHCHMNVKRFRRAVATGVGPSPSLHEIYKFPRYSVAELDRWQHATASREVAA